jgi:hypothetical protein
MPQTKAPRVLQPVVLFLCLAVGAVAEEVTALSQYGITWKFDRLCQVGKFVTGDYWVVGPVRVVEVTPKPGPAPADERTDVRKNQFGDAGLQDDRTMRHGSMIVLKAGGSQGYDSRPRNFDPALSVRFPCTLRPNESLISTVSNPDVNVSNFVHALMWASEKRSQLALRSAAVLTCLAQPPPADAFRPPYAGTNKPLHRLSELRWDLLSKLTPVGRVPAWEEMEGYVQRPWLDHVSSWLCQVTGPSENQPCYGREFSRVVSLASLMLMLDVPQERKEKLMIGFIQLGLDLHGLAQCGRQWQADGGHWSGRKWPILFAGRMLGDKPMQTLPPTLIFQEDQQTYFGKGWCGQSTLFQMVGHHGPRRPYEERAPDTWDDMDKRSESYRLCCTAKAWIGTALAVQLMEAKRLWQHEAYFDYCDRWMSLTDAYAAQRGRFRRPGDEGRTFDPFVDAMWAAYRPTVPAQEGATRSLKWVWGNNNRGEFVPNPKGAAGPGS